MVTWLSGWTINVCTDGDLARCQQVKATIDFYRRMPDSSIRVAGSTTQLINERMQTP